MADVTISSLPLGTPSGTDNIPYSNGVETNRVAVQNLPVAYSSITGKPVIPAAQVNSDWNASSGVTQILNKPTIPTINDSQLARAWFVWRNGTSYGGSALLVASYNVSSITGGTNSIWNINFANPMPSANYVVVGNAGSSSGRQPTAGSFSVAYTDNGSPPYTNFPSQQTVNTVAVKTTGIGFMQAVIYA